MYTVGIHGDPVAAVEKMRVATLQGVRLAETYGYPRAWRFTPEPQALGKVLDPTAAAEVFRLEAVRLGCETFRQRPESGRALLLKATVELPLKFGPALSALRRTRG